MKTTVLLEEKWKVQKELSEKSGYNLNKYAQLIDEIVRNIKIKYKIKKRWSQVD